MKEVLTLAISRLEWFVDAYPHDITVSKDEFLRPFKEALAQPEQEPIGWVDDCGQTFWTDKTPPDGADLYTTPPQRTWVGLTDEDWTYLRTNCGSIRSAVETAEAKLKERNT